MPDDGSWLSGSELRPGGAGETRAVRARFEQVLAEFSQRLASPVPMRRETAVALVEQMERLARRMGNHEDVLQGREADLSTALAALNARLETEQVAAAAREAQLSASLDRTLADLAEARAAKRPLFGAGAVRLVLAAAALCAVLCGAIAGVTVLNRPPTAKDPTPTLIVSIDEPTVAAAPPPMETLALPTAPRPVQRTADTFSTVSAALARGEPTALRGLNALAQAGDARAQLQLANFYETGASGLGRDIGAARRWTLRAARGGDRAAMYNAAVFLMEGEGGPRDIREAAVWFRRAAERGVTDAQYNLGLMYETGQGLEQDPTEARRWFALAAKAGDATAAAKLTTVEPAPAPPTTADGPSVADTQRYLAQQGYYVGPIDGLTSPTLQSAAKAYVRDHPGVAPRS